MKELAIGEIGEIDGVKVRCVEDDPQEALFCGKCVFDNTDGCSNDASECQALLRKDGRHVHFEEVKS